MTNHQISDDVITYLASPRSLSGQDDVLDVAGASMTYEQAYLAQFQSKTRQAGENGPIIGYQASLTSTAAKTMGPPDMPKPYVGTLQLRNWHDPRSPIAMGGRSFVIECETGMRLASPLKGPGITPDIARAAVASVHAAIEIVPITDALAGWSGQHMVAIHNFGSYVVFGEQIGDGQADISPQPVRLRFDGEDVASAIAGDSGGDPFAVLADIANIIGAYGGELDAGMIVMTGSCTPPTRLPAGTRKVEAFFGASGRVAISFTPSDHP